MTDSTHRVFEPKKRKPATQTAEQKKPAIRLKKVRNPNPPPPPAEYRWKPGQSGNPSGLSSEQKIHANLLSTAYLRALAQPVPGDPQGRTYAEFVAAGQIVAAAKGQTQAAIEVRKATEGELLRFSTMTDADLIKLLVADAGATSSGADTQGAGPTAPAGVSSAADGAPDGGE